MTKSDQLRSASAVNLDNLFAQYQIDKSDESLSHLLSAVYVTASRVISDEDAVQDAVAAVWARLPDITIKVSFSAWLWGAIRNVRHMVLRECINARASYGGDFDDSCPLPPVFSHTRLDIDSDTTLRRINTHTVEHALAESILAGSTLRRAAQQVGISEDAARKRLRRLGERLGKA